MKWNNACKTFCMMPGTWDVLSVANIGVSNSPAGQGKSWHVERLLHAFYCSELFTSVCSSHSLKDPPQLQIRKQAWGAGVK